MRVDFDIPDNLNLLGFAFPEDNNFGDDSSNSEDEIMFKMDAENSKKT